MLNPSERKPTFYHYLVAGLGLVLLAVVWAMGWLTALPDPLEGKEQAGLLMVLTALVLGAWNLVSCVIAAGFFHAASKHPAKTFLSYRAASLRLVFMGVLFVFPVPLMTQVLGADPRGRALALLVIGISMAGIAFGRARIRIIEKRLIELPEEKAPPKLAPFQ